MAEFHHIDDGYTTEDEDEVIIDEEFMMLKKAFYPTTVLATDTNVFKKYNLLRLIQFVNDQAMKLCRKEIETNNEVWEQWEEFITETLQDHCHIPPPQPKAKTTIPEEVKEELVSKAEWENHIRTYDIDF